MWIKCGKDVDNSARSMGHGAWGSPLSPASVMIS